MIDETMYDSDDSWDAEDPEEFRPPSDAESDDESDDEDVDEMLNAMADPAPDQAPSVEPPTFHDLTAVFGEGAFPREPPVFEEVPVEVPVEVPAVEPVEAPAEAPAVEMQEVPVLELIAEVGRLGENAETVEQLEKFTNAVKLLLTSAKNKTARARAIQKATAPRQRAPRGTAKKTAAQFFNQEMRSGISERYKAGGRSARLSVDAPKQSQIQAMLADEWKLLVDRSRFIAMAAAQ